MTPLGTRMNHVDVRVGTKEEQQRVDAKLKQLMDTRSAMFENDDLSDEQLEEQVKTINIEINVVIDGMWKRIK